MSPELVAVVPKSLEGFDAGMNDDLNTPRYACMHAWGGGCAQAARAVCANSDPNSSSGARSGIGVPFARLAACSQSRVDCASSRRGVI